MEYALKSENRKKFQDKQKLKRKHLTQSDRKYIKQNKDTKIENQEGKNVQNEQKTEVNDVSNDELDSTDDEEKVESKFSKKEIKSNEYRYNKEEEDEFQNRVNNIIDDSVIDSSLRLKLKQLALDKELQELTSNTNSNILFKKDVTKKDIEALSTKQLNELLMTGEVDLSQGTSNIKDKQKSGKSLNGESLLNKEPPSKPSKAEQLLTLSTAKNMDKTNQPKTNKTYNTFIDNIDLSTKNPTNDVTPQLPSQLQEEQDFLDGLL